MGFNDILKKLFGNKSQRDLREIQPYVDRILAEYAKIESLDNDELRRRVTDIRVRPVDIRSKSAAQAGNRTVFQRFRNRLYRKKISR